jgi:hypothetical protein
MLITSQCTFRPSTQGNARSKPTKPRNLYTSRGVQASVKELTGRQLSFFMGAGIVAGQITAVESPARAA